MAIGFDKAFGIHEQAVHLRARRSELLAANLANADTPGYKARDIDFRAVLNGVQSGAPRGLRVTHAAHLQGPGYAGGAEVLYRQPQQPSLDGNTVESQIEMAEFMRNALRYQASLQFLGGRVKGLMTAIKGQ